MSIKNKRLLWIRHISYFKILGFIMTTRNENSLIKDARQSKHFLKFIFNWQIIALQCCVDFCHTKTVINTIYSCFFKSRVSYKGFPGGPVGKESACIMGELGSITESGTSPGEGNGNPLQYSCLENSMDRGAWWATVHGVTKSWT